MPVSQPVEVFRRVAKLLGEYSSCLPKDIEPVMALRGEWLGLNTEELECVGLAIKDDFGIDVTEGEVASCETPAEIVALILKKTGHEGELLVKFPPAGEAQ